MKISPSDDKFYVERFEAKEPYGLDPKIINGTLYYRDTYGKVINKCINMDLWQKYGLEGHTEINFCSSNRDYLPFGKSFIQRRHIYYYSLLHEERLVLTYRNLPIFLSDFLDFTFVIILVLIICIVSFATAYDGNMLKFKSNKENSILILVTRSFSISRNWKRLVSKPTTEVAKDLVYVHTLRTITMVFIVYAHVFIGFNFAPALNPQYIEEVI